MYLSFDLFISNLLRNFLGSIPNSKFLITNSYIKLLSERIRRLINKVYVYFCYVIIFSVVIVLSARSLSFVHFMICFNYGHRANCFLGLYKLYVICLHIYMSYSI